MKRIWKTVAVVTIGLFCGLDLQAQFILQDQNGAHLYVAGTEGDDVVFVWQEAGELLVSLNGTLTNVTKETGVTAAKLHSVGTNLYGGDDVVSYQLLPVVPGGTITNGGAGEDAVFEGKGKHKGANVAHWTKTNTVDPSQTVDSPDESAPSTEAVLPNANVTPAAEPTEPPPGQPFPEPLPGQPFTDPNNEHLGPAAPKPPWEK